MLPDRNDRNNRVCPVERGGILDHTIRRWLQDPQKILRPYIEEGMTVLDIGCGRFLAIALGRKPRLFG